MTALRVVVGTGEDCDVRVADDPYVSTKHCQVWWDPAGRLLIQDLGSTNGTYLERDGGRIRVWGPTEIAPGDTIWLGGRTAIPWGSMAGTS